MNLIFRHTVTGTMTETERGETITRGGRPAAETGVPRRSTGADLRAALADIEPPDDHFTEDIAAALALLTTEGGDPWAGA